jgi:hypothetical protein
LYRLYFLNLNTNVIAPNTNANISINICSGHVVGNASASCPALNKSIATSSESIFFHSKAESVFHSSIVPVLIFSVELLFVQLSLFS